MAEFTQILLQIERGERAADDLFVLVYDDLKRLAGMKLGGNRESQTLRPTVLVHEAFLRLFQGEVPQFENRKHFFCIAAEAMRRIIVEDVRRKRSVKHGGNVKQECVSDFAMAQNVDYDQIIDVHEALDTLAQISAQAAEIVKLRYFAGLEIPECAEILNLSESTVKRHWKFAKVWLHDKLGKKSTPSS